MTNDGYRILLFDTCVFRFSKCKEDHDRNAYDLLRHLMFPIQTRNTFYEGQSINVISGCEMLDSDNILYWFEWRCNWQRKEDNYKDGGYFNWFGISATLCFRDETDLAVYRLFYPQDDASVRDWSQRNFGFY